MQQDLELEEGIILDPLVDDKVEDEPATVCVWATGGQEERNNNTSGYQRLPEFIPFYYSSFQQTSYYSSFQQTGFSGKRFRVLVFSQPLYSESIPWVFGKTIQNTKVD
jgi:hypothetical protein